MSRNLLIYLCALSSLSSSLSFRHGQNQLRDLYAYPKYEVQFLNDLPLSRSDALRCQSLGVDSEEQWLEPSVRDGRRLGDGSDEEVKDQDHLELVPMNFAHPSDGPSGTPYPYLCLMPSRNTTVSQTDLIDKLDQVEEVEDELDPVQGWQALSHLEGKCLFTKQGWFTYSYCHNSHIRQFHAAAHPHPHPPGGLVPVEDTKYDAYTLGQVSPGARQRFANIQQQQPGGNVAKQRDLQALTKNQESQSKALPSISIGSSSSSRSRYLVQKWSYGTRCDKTGKPREVEVQIHCSMTTGDMIYMIKEMSICQYVLIIHSPYLCGLPGFKNHQDHLEKIGPAPVRCRQIVEDSDWRAWETENEQQRKGRGLEEIDGEEERKDGKLGLPYGKRPTGADTPPSENEKEIQHHFGLKGPDQMFPDTQGQGQGEDEEMEIVFEGSDVEDESLRNMLKQALELLGKKTQSGKSKEDTDTPEGEGGEDEIKGEQVIFYSWEEGDDEDEGPILLNADLVVLDDDSQDGDGGEEGDGEGVKEKARVQLGNREKDVLEKVVRDFLSQKKEKKEDEQGKRNRDEL
ncbi:hypothetical protein I302_100262 [Kwoniella bestiolae CBS 10118]|uniref:Protein OS-9 homolog n=1 Tax=Kwoniella bestiolae CBS 10118 TaxID=1296100 RepID=A0A1B9G4I7_9TREE|nr:hypothetical protein I302_03634 [Kwoniella bestiolae CBS 10118]OCF25957.1 hypothetical protein I302_03634 [Kwoniella bestiolae CBS 10118]